eukprot:scaffold11066_cov151-Skeletonema_menzelii.AAC.3
MPGRLRLPSPPPPSNTQPPTDQTALERIARRDSFMYLGTSNDTLCVYIFCSVMYIMNSRLFHVRLFHAGVHIKVCTPGFTSVSRVTPINSHLHRPPTATAASGNLHNKSL